MSKLDSLKIDDCPYAFASFAAKHNALVDMLAGMTGQNGVTVVIAEKNAIIRGQSNSNGGGGGTTLSNVANVVGSDGLLQNVYTGAAIANAWPSAGKWVTSAGNVTIDNTRFTSTMPGRFVTSAGNIDVSSTGFVMTKSDGKLCNIAFASLTHDMSIQRLAVCSNGSPANIDIVASAPY